MANLEKKSEALKQEVETYINAGQNEVSLRRQLFETLRAYDRQIDYQLKQITDLEIELDKHGLL